MRSATSGRARTVTRFAATSAASILVIGLLPSGPAAATMSAVESLAAALCPTGPNTGTAALSGDVTSEVGSSGVASGFPVEVLEVAAGCVATLDLNGETLTVRSIKLGAGSTLTIKDASDGDGELIARSLFSEFGSSFPGIDAGGATLVIEGGVVQAEGNGGRAGIRTFGGTLVVEGGNVVATGGSSSAGIGASSVSDSQNLDDDGGTVTISGGTVTATGGAFGGAGIGGRRFGDGGTVTISGGSVVATAGNTDAKAIGAGGGGNGDGQLTLGPGAVPVSSFTESGFPVTSITFVAVVPVVDAPNPAGPSFFAPGGVQPSQPVASAAFVRADGTPEQLAASVPGRNQVRYEADGVRITLQGGSGTSVPRGLVANPAGEVICEVCIANLTAGQVVEVWLFSTPRLVAAHLVEDAECQLFAVPMVAPLDGAGPVSAGAHTLQFTLVTSDGVQAVNVGLTVGDLMPARIPAGEGPSMPRASVLLSIAFLSVAAVLGRRRSVIAT